MDTIQWVTNSKYQQNHTLVDFLSPDRVTEVVNFHKSFPQYKETPLQVLDALAKEFAVKKIWVKDESFRFGLNAFKGLGGSFAIGKYLAGKLGLDIKSVTFKLLQSPEVKAKLGHITFVTATDGNHGRGVAWAARQLGHKAVVYMPKGSAVARLKNIRAQGAEASITDLNYDDTVRLADQKAKENGWIMVQDTAWDGYEEIPAWIMQGYTTIMHEALEQIAASGEHQPTHVFLQAGVGCFAGSMLGALKARFGDQCPITTIVEPNQAACIYKSIKAADGQPHAVTGDLHTIMAGLACGEPSTLSWHILNDYASYAVSCPDYVSACGMRILANPLGHDPHVVSGESGAVGLGLLSFLHRAGSDVAGLAEKLQLNSESKILVISTEGDTDPVNYRKVIWDGAYSFQE
jgi:diaminopropionate ammonia-lyase